MTRPNILIALCLALILLGYTFLMQPALTGPFLFDDFPNLQNLAYLSGNLDGDYIGKYLASFIGSPGRPIAALSFLINDNAWPSNPYSFRHTNVMIHLLNGTLLFGLLRSLAKASPCLPQSVIWPLLVMAAWLFHPLQLSAQMLVVQRMTLLSTTFCFAGLWAYTVLLLRSRSIAGAFAAITTLGTATLLAFLCKENGALLPVLAWCMNVTLLQHVLEEKNYYSRALIRAGCILPSLGLFAGIIYMGTRDGAFASREFNMIERLMTQTHVISDYLYHILMPRLSGSGIYFDDYPIARSWFNPISTLFLGLAITASIVTAVLQRNKTPILSFAVLWFFAGHLMESTILDLELYFEHRNYLPLLGPIVALTSIPFLLKPHLKKIGGVILGLWLSFLVIITSLQAPVWGNQHLMAKLWALEHPMSLRASQELARSQYESKNYQGAFNTLIDAYKRGLNFTDLPLAALLTQCYVPSIKYDEDIITMASEGSSLRPFTGAAIEAMSKLQTAVSKNHCPDTINGEQWLILSTQLLNNKKYPISKIRLLRAKYFYAKRDFQMTISELELAYISGPSVELTQTIADVLLSAGHTSEAKFWLMKGLQLKQPFFDSLMYDPKENSRNLLKAIENAKSKQPYPVINKTK